MPIRISETLKRLLIVYGVVFVIQHGIDQFMGGNVEAWFGLVPALVLQGRIWQLFTYSFLHFDVMHLILNLLVLALVGSDLEAIWGRKKFFTFYFFCTTLAGIFYLFVQFIMHNPLYMMLPMVGASGGIYGLLMAYALIFPDREMLFMMLFPMKAKQFVWLLAGIEFLQALFSGQGGLGALAQLSGMGAGFAYLWFETKGYQIRKNREETKRKKGTNHLRLIKNDDDDNNNTPKTWH
jgi:membrane associated rhomboid family serine protease